MSRKGTAEFLIVFAVFVLVNLTCLFFQKPISLAGGKGWDGVQTYSMAEQFVRGKLPIVADAPHVWRIGTPFLASLLIKSDLFLSFKVVNVIANILTVILLVVWLRFYISSWRIRTVLVVLFMVNWIGPVRFTFFYAPYVDPWLYTCLLAGLILIHMLLRRMGPEWLILASLSALSFLGVLFRESMLIIPLALLASRDLYSFKFKRLVLYSLPLVCAVLGDIFAHVISQHVADSLFLDTAWSWAYVKPPMTYIHAWFIAYGPMLALLLFAWRPVLKFLMEHQFQLFYLMAMAVSAAFAGDDTDRYLTWAMPVVLVLLGKAAESWVPLRASALLLGAFAFGQALAERVIWPIPDYPTGFPDPITVLTPFGRDVPYLDLWSLHAPRQIEQEGASQYVIVVAVLLVWLALTKKIDMMRAQQVMLLRDPRVPIAAQALLSVVALSAMVTGWYRLNVDKLTHFTQVAEDAHWPLGPSPGEGYGLAFKDGLLYVTSFARNATGYVGSHNLQANAGRLTPIQPVLADGTLVKFAHPGDVKVGKDGLLYVLNNGQGGQEADSLLVMEADGKVDRRITLAKKSLMATGLDLDGNGGFYVADMQGGDVLHYGPNGGEPQAIWSNAGKVYNNPAGVTLGSDGHIYVMETEARVVHELEPTGKPVRDYILKCKPVHAVADGDWLDITCGQSIVSINIAGHYVQESHFEPANSQPSTPTGITYASPHTLFVLDGNMLHRYKITH